MAPKAVWVDHRTPSEGIGWKIEASGIAFRKGSIRVQLCTLEAKHPRPILPFEGRGSCAIPFRCHRKSLPCCRVRIGLGSRAWHHRPNVCDGKRAPRKYHRQSVCASFQHIDHTGCRPAGYARPIDPDDPFDGVCWRPPPINQSFNRTDRNCFCAHGIFRKNRNLNRTGTKAGILLLFGVVGIISS